MKRVRGVYPSSAHLPIREVTLGSKANGVDQIFGVCSPAVFCLDSPSMCLAVELGTNNPRLKSYIFFNIQLAFDMLKVLPQLVVAGVLFRPGPVLGSCQRGAAMTIVFNV